MEQMFNTYGEAVCNYIENLIIVDRIRRLDSSKKLKLKLNTYSDRVHSVILEDES